MKFPLKTMTHLNFSGVLIFKLSIVKRELKRRYRVYFTNCHEEKEKGGILLPFPLDNFFLSIIVTRLSARIFVFNHFHDEISNENEISWIILEWKRFVREKNEKKPNEFLIQRAKIETYLPRPAECYQALCHGARYCDFANNPKPNRSRRRKVLCSPPWRRPLVECGTSGHRRAISRKPWRGPLRL